MTMSDSFLESIVEAHFDEEDEELIHDIGNWTPTGTPTSELPAIFFLDHSNDAPFTGITIEDMTTFHPMHPSNSLEMGEECESTRVSHSLSPNLITPSSVSSTLLPSRSRKKDDRRVGCHSHMTNTSLVSLLNIASVKYFDDPFEPRPIHPSCEQKYDDVLVPKMSSCRNDHLDQKTGGFETDSYQPMGKIPSSSRTAFRRLSIQQALDVLGFSIEDIDEGGYVSPSILNDDHTNEGYTNFSNILDQASTLSNTPIMKTSMLRLTKIMKKSRQTQDWLQELDKRNGLPRSHCCTMMHTNRSRRQLEEGRILPKWNGAPLIGNNRVNCVGSLQNGKEKKKVRRHEKLSKK